MTISLSEYAQACRKGLEESVQAREYLVRRDIPQHWAVLFQLGAVRTGAERVPGPGILLPVLDYWGRLVSVSVNLFSGAPKYWHLPFPKQRWLWGLHLRPDEEKPPVIVEGQYDALQLRRLGWPAYSILGSSLSVWQAGHLCYLAPKGEVIIYPDKDKPTLVEQAARVLRAAGLRPLASELPYEPWENATCDPDELCRMKPEFILEQLAGAKVVER